MAFIRIDGDFGGATKRIQTDIKHQKTDVVGITAKIVVVGIKPKARIMYRVNARIHFIQISIAQQVRHRGKDDIRIAWQMDAHFICEIKADSQRETQ